VYGHKFVQHQFYNIMRCALCGDLLKYSAGMQCEDCKYTCHTKCYTSVVTKCISKSNAETDPDEEKINHRIPHRFQAYSNMTANWCCHCGYMMPFGKKNSRKCTGEYRWASKLLYNRVHELTPSRMWFDQPCGVCTSGTRFLRHVHGGRKPDLGGHQGPKAEAGQDFVYEANATARPHSHESYECPLAFALLFRVHDRRLYPGTFVRCDGGGQGHAGHPTTATKAFRAGPSTAFGCCCCRRHRSPHGGPSVAAATVRQLRPATRRPLRGGRVRLTSRGSS
jgi:hypothetical protein